MKVSLKVLVLVIISHSNIIIRNVVQYRNYGLITTVDVLLRVPVSRLPWTLHIGQRVGANAGGSWSCSVAGRSLGFFLAFPQL